MRTSTAHAAQVVVVDVVVVVVVDVDVVVAVVVDVDVVVAVAVVVDVIVDVVVVVGKVVVVAVVAVVVVAVAVVVVVVVVAVAMVVVVVAMVVATHLQRSSRGPAMKLLLLSYDRPFVPAVLRMHCLCFVSSINQASHCAVCVQSAAHASQSH